MPSTRPERLQRHDPEDPVELGFNYVDFEPDYDDPRDHLCTRAESERAETHDPCWNAATIQLRKTGYLHNCMRMCWGKKILVWSITPG